MKRHPSLVPLSREHHETLILAQVIKKGAPQYRGMPVDLEHKMEAVVNHLRLHLIHHFKKEEQMFAKMQGRFPEVDQLISQLTEEHRRIEMLIGELGNPVSLEEKLHELGELLEAHIRKEERQLFELIPQRFDGAFLGSLPF
jgi:hemerythrin-like domain-containing protein